MVPPTVFLVKGEGVRDNVWLPQNSVLDALYSSPARECLAITPSPQCAIKPLVNIFDSGTTMRVESGNQQASAGQAAGPQPSIPAGSANMHNQGSASAVRPQRRAVTVAPSSPSLPAAQASAAPLSSRVRELELSTTPRRQRDPPSPKAFAGRKRIKLSPILPPNRRELRRPATLIANPLEQHGNVSGAGRQSSGSLPANVVAKKSTTKDLARPPPFDRWKTAGKAVSVAPVSPLARELHPSTAPASSVAASAEDASPSKLVTGGQGESELDAIGKKIEKPMQKNKAWDKSKKGPLNAVSAGFQRQAMQELLSRRSVDKRKPVASSNMPPLQPLVSPRPISGEGMKETDGMGPRDQTSLISTKEPNVSSAKDKSKDGIPNASTFKLQGGVQKSKEAVKSLAGNLSSKTPASAPLSPKKKSHVQGNAIREPNVSPKKVVSPRSSRDVDIPGPKDRLRKVAPNSNRALGTKPGRKSAPIVSVGKGVSDSERGSDVKNLSSSMQESQAAPVNVIQLPKPEGNALKIPERRAVHRQESEAAMKDIGSVAEHRTLNGDKKASGRQLQSGKKDIIQGRQAISGRVAAASASRKSGANASIQNPDERVVQEHISSQLSTLTNFFVVLDKVSLAVKTQREAKRSVEDRKHMALLAIRQTLKSVRERKSFSATSTDSMDTRQVAVGTASAPLQRGDLLSSVATPSHPETSDSAPPSNQTVPPRAATTTQQAIPSISLVPGKRGDTPQSPMPAQLALRTLSSLTPAKRESGTSNSVTHTARQEPGRNTSTPTSPRNTNSAYSVKAEDVQGVQFMLGKWKTAILKKETSIDDVVEWTRHLQLVQRAVDKNTVSISEKDLRAHMRDIHTIAPTQLFLTEALVKLVNRLSSGAEANVLEAEDRLKVLFRAVEAVVTWAECIIVRYGHSFSRLESGKDQELFKPYAEEMVRFVQVEYDTEGIIGALKRIRKKIFCEENEAAVKKPLKSARRRLSEIIGNVLRKLAAITRMAVNFNKRKGGDKDGTLAPASPRPSASNDVRRQTSANDQVRGERSSKHLASSKPVDSKIGAASRSQRPRGEMAVEQRKNSDRARSFEKSGTASRISDTASKKAVGSHSTSAARHGLSGTDVTPFPRKLAESNATIDLSKYSDAKALKATGGISKPKPSVNKNRSGSSNLESAKKVTDLLLGNAKRKGGTDAKGGGPTRQQASNSGKGKVSGEADAGKKRKVRFAEQLISDDHPSKHSTEELRTLFNDGYDLLGGHNDVQEKAVLERSRNLSRGSVFAFYGFLRSYVAAQKNAMEGRNSAPPEWISVRYPPSAQRQIMRMMETKEKGGQSGTKSNRGGRR